VVSKEKINKNSDSLRRKTAELNESRMPLVYSSFVDGFLNLESVELGEAAGEIEGNE